jgi:hypothetical protein
MSRAGGVEARPRPRAVARRPEDRRRIGRAAALWGYLALGSIVTMTALILWHLARRGRLIRDRLGPPRVVRLPELERPGPDGPPGPSP